MKRLFFFLMGMALVLCYYVRAEYDMTVIIVNSSNKDCKVLEGFDTQMERFVPDGWSIIALDENTCDQALVRMKERDFEPAIKDYVGLLNCSKDTAVRSLSYFGRGAKDICEVAGYDFVDTRIVVSNKPVPEKKDGNPVWYILVVMVIIILVFLIMIKKEKA